MKKTVIDYLRETTKKYDKKTAWTTVQDSITYEDFTNKVDNISTSIANKGLFNKPIAIFIDRNISCLEAMLGIVGSGNFYTVLDVLSPMDRINQIVNTLDTRLIITDTKMSKKLEQLDFSGDILLIEDLINTKVDMDLLTEINNKIIDTNPMYILFTSGSTGVPKGTVVSHRAVISYIKWFVECFEINSETSFGSETPFYFSMSVSDIYSTIFTGATFNIIPKMYFSFPVKLLGYLNEKEINTIYWVPSALCIVANLKALDEVKLPYLKKVLFAGEVMPTKQLNMWMDKVNCYYANLYGPTETVDICTYYEVNSKIKDGEVLPIGKACNNCDVLIVNEKNELAKVGEKGELLVRGSFLASGYYNNLEKTKEQFIQNPINKFYPEIVYRTGDLVKLGEDGNILYLSRKDYQIKHKGVRIELGEIESKINTIDGIILCSVIFDKDNDKIILYYQSNELDDIILLKEIKKKLPNYMHPNKVIKLDRMPYNSNGKIDKKKLEEDYKKIEV